MDRRKSKTRTAIFRAFTSLLEERSLQSISVQDIIDRADIGRSTFYSHFEMKDDLLCALCKELFDHIIETAMNPESHSHGLYHCDDAPDSVFMHILLHLQENDNSILTLLTCESNEFFLRYFKDNMSELIRRKYLPSLEHCHPEIPDDFLVNHIAGSFVEMVLFWLKNRKQYTPQQLDSYFRSMIGYLGDGG